MTIPHMLALDFDSVLCDGMREYTSRQVAALTCGAGLTSQPRARISCPCCVRSGQ